MSEQTRKFYILGVICLLGIIALSTELRGTDKLFDLEPSDMPGNIGNYKNDVTIKDMVPNHQEFKDRDTVMGSEDKLLDLNSNIPSQIVLSEDRISVSNMGWTSEIVNLSISPSTKITFFDSVMTIEKDGTFTYMGEEIQGAPEIYEAFQNFLNGVCNDKEQP